MKLGTDAHGNISRLDNALAGLEDRRSNCESQLSNVRMQMETAKGELDRAFPQESELSDKSSRLKELNILLNMDQKDREILDAEPDEGDIAPPQRTPEMVR